MPHATNELLRKSLHIAIGLGALTLKWLSWPLAAAVCVVAIFSNWLFLHRLLGKGVARHERGYDAGIVLYPAAVLVLVVVFRHHLHLAAIGWVILAFGDGVATLAGKSMGLGPLPWNRDKSWGGLVACFAAGAGAGLGIAWWMSLPHPMRPAVLVVIAAALAGAVTESLALGVDDNVTVPLAAAVVLAIGSIEGPASYGVFMSGLAPWLVANAALALAGFFLRSVSFSGALGGWALGTIILLSAGWPMYLTLLVFFVLGTGVTRLGYRRKAELGLAQDDGGRRGFSHAFSNAGVATICAFAVSRSTDLAVVLPIYLMGIASLATAAADTTASEIGQLLGRRAFLPLTLRPVPRGTEGAVSVEGTLAGLAGGLVVGAAGVLALDYGLLPDASLRVGWRAVALIAACAFLGSYLESIAGSWNRKRIRPVPNGVLNFFNTAAGALLMYGAWQITT